MAIEGDLRFLSHHDLMRVMGRIASRAGIPIRYSQGFNPRPALSLPCPRPVGVASEDDLLVLAVEDEPSAAQGQSVPAAPGQPPVRGTMDESELLDRLNRHAPAGMRFFKARPLAGSRAPQPTGAEYELPLPDERLGDVAERLGALECLDSWPVARSRGRDDEPQGIIDLRPLTAELKLEGPALRMRLVAGEGGTWARPGEVLRLLGLDDRTDLASTVRRHVDYEF